MVMGSEVWNISVEYFIRAKNQMVFVTAWWSRWNRYECIRLKAYTTYGFECSLYLQMHGNYVAKCYKQHNTDTKYYFPFSSVFIFEAFIIDYMYFPSLILYYHRTRLVFHTFVFLLYLFLFVVPLFSSFFSFSAVVNCAHRAWCCAAAARELGKITQCWHNMGTVIVHWVWHVKKSANNLVHCFAI